MSEIDLTNRPSSVEIGAPVETTQTCPVVASYPYRVYFQDPNIKALQDRCDSLENRIRELEERLSGIS